MTGGVLRGLLAFVALWLTCAAGAKEKIIFNRAGAPSSSALYISHADGTGERRVLAGSGLDYSPSFSRDGQWIVFTSERNGSADIYRVHPDGSGLEHAFSSDRNTNRPSTTTVFNRMANCSS